MNKNTLKMVKVISNFRFKIAFITTTVTTVKLVQPLEAIILFTLIHY